MKSVILSAVARLCRVLQRPQPPITPTIRARPMVLSRFESLERRDVLSATSVIPFATIPAQVAAGQTAQVVLHFSAGQITSDRNAPVIIGFYAKPATGSAVVPQVSEVDGFAGQQTRLNLPIRGGVTPSKALFLTTVNPSSTAAQDITVNVTSPNGKAGGIVLEAFLPGDTQGDGTVNAIDLSHVQAIYGSAVGQSTYDPASDFNLDGHVGCIDRRLTELNLGSHAAYTPVTSTSVSTAAVTPTPTPTVQATPTTVIATPVVQATPVVSTPVIDTPVVQATPVVSTSTAATPIVATTQQATPIVLTTPVVQAAPLVQTASLVAAQPTSSVVVTQPTSSLIATQQPTAIQLVPLPASSSNSNTIAYGAAAPYTVTTTQSSTPYYIPVATSSPTSAATTSAPTYLASPQPPIYYYSQPLTSPPTTSSSATATAITSSNSLATAPTQAYYYSPQPLTQTSVPLQATGTTPIYYYGQPVVQAPNLTTKT